jgi:hypothetical protein
VTVTEHVFSGISWAPKTAPQKFVEALPHQPAVIKTFECETGAGVMVLVS